MMTTVPGLGKRSGRMLKTLVAVISALSTAAFIPAADAAPKALVCDGTFNGGTYFSVQVPAGASCTLTGAKVTHGVHARDAANVLLIDTNVGRNIDIRGTTGMTQIGTPEDPSAARPLRCRIDPIVGNNVMVRRSHDVLICQVHAKDNIMVTRNDGQITVRDSEARTNIMVSHNLPFVGPPLNKHRDPGAIRLLDDTAGQHIFARHDSSRDLIFRNDIPEPINH